MGENTYKITSVLETDGKTTKQSHQYRVGRTGRIFNLITGVPMYFEYMDGHGMLITSPVKSIKEDDRGMKITTKNSIYVLDNYKE